MARMDRRTRPCTKSTTEGRRRKIDEFWEAALICDAGSRGETHMADAVISMCVLAGIASADVICCVRLGEHATGESHDDAVRLLSKIDRELAGSLRRLLGVKTRSGYSELGSGAQQRRQALRSAQKLVEAAKATR